MVRRERETERDRERDRHRQTGRQTDRQTDRQTENSTVSISTLGKTKFSGSVENQDPQETCAVHYKLSGMLS